MTATKCGKRVAEGIYWQADGSLSIRFSTGRRRPGKASYEYYTETFRGSVKDAIARRAKLITEFAEGRLKPPERKKTFGEYCQQYFEHNRTRKEMGKITASTEEFYRQTLERHFKPLWDVPLAKVSAKQVLAVLLDLRNRGLSTDYLLSVFHAFRAAWRASKRLKVSVPDILDDVAEMMPASVKKRRIIYTPQQCRVLLAAAEDDPITHGIVTFLLNTMTRINECFGFRFSDGDISKLEVVIEQQVLKRPGPDGSRFGPHKTFKTHGPRVIRMTTMLAEELRHMRSVVAAMRLKAGAAWQDNDLVFPTSIGTPQSYGWWERTHWVPLLKKANLPRIRVHDLRHSMVTFLLSEGVPVTTVQEIAGHADIATTDAYKHLLVSAQDEAMRKLDQAFRQ